MSDEDQEPNIGVTGAIWALASLWGIALLSEVAGVFRVWRYEEDEYGSPIRRQHRYTGRVQVRTKEGWR